MTIFYNAMDIFSITVCMCSNDCLLEKLYNGKFSNENPCFNLNSWFLIVNFCLYHVRIEGGICFFGSS